MDVLEKYKKAWSNQPEEKVKVSEKEIYRMAHSRSSSIVKWILIIGILEFVVLNSLYFFIDVDKAQKEYERLGLEDFIFYTQIAGYAIVFYFLYMFYKNYKNISSSDSTKTLMKKIIKTRKTVRNYVLFNLAFFALVMLAATIASIQVDFNDLTNKQLVFVVIFMFIFSLIILAVLFLFYQLLYGILLRKLNRNYKELSNIEL